MESLLKSAAKYGKNELLTRFDIPFYRRKGYEHTYLGPSVYNSVKYSFRYSDRLYAGVVAEKMLENLLELYTIVMATIIIPFICY